jgi:hypothetical protein
MARGVSDPVAEFNIRLAIIELCQRSLIWREYQPAITTDGIKTAFAFTPAAGQHVSRLLTLTLDGLDVPLADPKAGKAMDAANATNIYAYGGFSAFELRPAQPEGRSIITYSAVAPSIIATEVPDSFSRYAEKIGRGALWRLQATHGLNYSDKSAALFTRELWEDDIGSVQNDAFIGLSRTAPRTAPNWF